MLAILENDQELDKEGALKKTNVSTHVRVRRKHSV